MIRALFVILLYYSVCEDYVSNKVFRPYTFQYHYYCKDHLGDNRVVVSEDGEIEQVTHYYPYGGLFGDVNTEPRLQPNKFGGKEFQHTHGLDLYDFLLHEVTQARGDYLARQYDPATGLFTSMDPLCEKYYHISPYAYCAGNPVNVVDLNGQEPTPKEAAYIADHIYGRTNELIGGWQLYYMNSMSNGLQYGIYEREKKDGNSKYVLAFAGTNDSKDVVQDINKNYF